MKLKKSSNYKVKFIGIRLTQEEYNNLKMRALHLCEGNISQYALYCINNFMPNKDDLEKGEAFTPPQKKS